MTGWVTVHQFTFLLQKSVTYTLYQEKVDLSRKEAPVVEIFFLFSDRYL